MIKKTQNISILRFTDFSYTFPVLLDYHHSPVSLSNYKLEGRLQKYRDDATVVTLNAVYPSPGVVTVSMHRNLTASLTVGDWYYEVFAIHDTDKSVQAIFTGIAHVADVSLPK